MKFSQFQVLLLRRQFGYQHALKLTFHIDKCPQILIEVTLTRIFAIKVFYKWGFEKAFRAIFIHIHCCLNFRLLDPNNMCFLNITPALGAGDQKLVLNRKFSINIAALLNLLWHYMSVLPQLWLRSLQLTVSAISSLCLAN